MSDKPSEGAAAMADYERDEYDQYDYDQDKITNSSHSGKGRSKKEAAENTNRVDPGGHTRKTVTKLMNNHEKEKEANKTTKPEKKT